MQKVLAIVGPTAVGKTALAIKLAKRFSGEVISGDSMQVYRRLDIGTAKVMPDEMDGVPHHLINILDVDQGYSVAQFCADAERLITEITDRGHLPIIAGGTGFYLQALLERLNLGGDTESDGAVRAELKARAAEVGNQGLWEQLKAVDPAAAAKIPVNNLRRVIRALEVTLVSGQPFSEQPQFQAPYDALLVALNTDRALLYRRINQRVDLMVQSGLIPEARWLFDNGGTNLPAGKGIGYRELYPYFAGEVAQVSAIDKIKQDSRHYAKRQLTWFRNQMDCHWFDLVQHPDESQSVEQLVTDWRHR